MFNSAHSPCLTFQSRRAWTILLLAGFLGGTAHSQSFNLVNADGTVDTFCSGYYNDNNLNLNGNLLSGYHPQVTAYFCGAASMEMELDCAAVRSQNNVIERMLNGGGGNRNQPLPAAVDGNPVACNPPGRCWPQIQFQGNQVVGGAQTYVYGLVHGFTTYNGNTYFNPFWPVGSGTGLDCWSAGLNLMDSPANFNAGPHNYISYNYAATSPPFFIKYQTVNGKKVVASATFNPANTASFNRANRNIANVLIQMGIPVVAGINAGGHAICVYGVETTSANNNPVPGGVYTIEGFWIHDPWTGFWTVNKAKYPKADEGVGENKYVSLRGNPTRPAKEWEFLFTPATGPLLPAFGSGYGYKYEMEPIGPEPEDPGTNYSIPAPSPILPNAPLTAAEALNYATTNVDDDSALDGETGLDDGGWDLADAILVQYPTDTNGQGDWLIPYDGSGGPNDVTGFVMIDIQTGDLDEATWMDPSDVVTNMLLADVDDMETNEADDNLPDDNFGEPLLNIQSPGANPVTLAWPVYSLATNTYILQQTTNLLSPNWTTALAVTNIINGSNIATVPMIGPQAYFRLYSPTNGP